MKMPIWGVVENMSHLVLPDSGKRLEVFGKAFVEATSKRGRQAPKAPRPRAVKP